MKKLILFLSLVVLLFSCKSKSGQISEAQMSFAQLDSSITIVDSIANYSANDSINTYTGTAVEILLEKYSPQIRKDVVQVLKIGKDLTEYSFNVVVRQVVVVALVNVIILLVGFIMLFLVWTKYCHVKDGEDKYSDEPKRWFIAFIVMCIVQFVIICCTLNPIFTGLFNPEFGAVKEFFDLLKNLI